MNRERVLVLMRTLAGLPPETLRRLVAGLPPPAVRALVEEWWWGARGEATQAAQDEMPAMQRQFGATAVKVVDESGNPCFLRAISRNP